MNLLKIYSNKVKILPSKLTKNVAIYGAAALVWKSWKNKLRILRVRLKPTRRILIINRITIARQL